MLHKLNHQDLVCKLDTQSTQGILLQTLPLMQRTVACILKSMWTSALHATMAAGLHTTH